MANYDLPTNDWPADDRLGEPPEPETESGYPEPTIRDHSIICALRLNPPSRSAELPVKRLTCTCGLAQRMEEVYIPW